MSRPGSRWLVISVCGYAVLVIAVVAAMYWTRERVLAGQSPQSTANWEQWREDVRQQEAHPGPVERRVPKSSEPPALVLMRDHFPVSLTGALMFSTALYWVMAWFIAGVMGSQGNTV